MHVAENGHQTAFVCVMLEPVVMKRAERREVARCDGGDAPCHLTVHPARQDDAVRLEAL